jgi:hypothetical protein
LYLFLYFASFVAFRRNDMAKGDRGFSLRGVRGGFTRVFVAAPISGSLMQMVALMYRRRNDAQEAVMM